MAWALVAVSVLVVLLGIACWCIHLLFQQGRRNQKISGERRAELEEAIAAQRLRIEDLEREVDGYKMRSDKQAEFIHQQRLASTQRPSTRDFVIHEEP